MERLLTRCKYGVLRRVGVQPLEGPRPDFLGIGVPQGATTWLFEALRRHPGIFLPDCKELRYFDVRFYRPASWYQKHFPAEGERVRGEITPAYCTLSRPQIEVLDRMLPGVKVVLMLRHPVRRVWSAARRILGLLGGRDMAKVDEGTLRRVMGRKDVQARTDYSRMLDDWTEVFGPDRLLVELQEDVGKDPRALLGRIVAHVGAPTDLDMASLVPEGRVNANPRATIPAHLKAVLEERYAPVIDAVRQRLGDRVDVWTTGAA